MASASFDYSMHIIAHFLICEPYHAELQLINEKCFYSLVISAALASQLKAFEQNSIFYIRHSKGLIILPTARGVLADFWVPNEIDS